MMMNPLGVRSPHITIKIMMMMHPLGLLSTHITAQGTLIERDSQQGMIRVSLSWDSFIGFPMHSIYPASGNGSNRMVEDFLWGSP